MSKTFDLSRLLNDNETISLKQRINFVWKLSIPGMMAQISSILMQYIDAAMVGSLGANQSASIGLVASSTWVIGSLLHALAVGFTVQIAHAVGAGKKEGTRNILFNALLCCILFSVFIAIVAGSLSFRIPLWLGASNEIYMDAAWYFLIFAFSSPLYEVVYLFSGVQQGAGNMKLPGILNALMCFLDIVFNYLFIFVLNMGVKGAALGSASAALSVALIFSYFTLIKSDTLNFVGHRDFFVDRAVLKKAVKLALPVGLESSAFSGALVVITRLIAPLGAVSLAANSFAVTAESLCYMPGYGVQEATTTLVGQSYGAKRKDLIRSFSWITVAYGMGIMALIAVIMYFTCPYIFAFITPDLQIQEFSVKILRIALFAEPLFGASIVATGALRGKGDTLVPSIMNLFSLWVVRLGVSFMLVKPYGLVGIWIAMATELCFRGLIMLCRLAFAKTRF